MYWLFPYIPIFRGFFLLKVQKECVYMIMLKIAMVLVKNLIFGLKKGISRLSCWVVPKHNVNTRFFFDKKGKQAKRYQSHQSYQKKNLVTNFALSDAEDNNSRPLNRGRIAYLPLLERPLAICQKSQESGFWEVMDSFVLLAYVSLAASRTCLQ